MKWKSETRKIKDLKPYSRNARLLNKHNAEHLQKSLEKFGVCEPIIINTDGTIIGGHQRINTLKKMNIKEVLVNIPERTLDDKEVEELNIRLNKNTGSFDDEMLANIYEIEDLINYGFMENELGICQDLSQEKSKTFKINISFQNLDDLEEVEKLISPIIDNYTGANYKIKIN